MPLGECVGQAFMSIARGRLESPSVARKVSHHDNKPRRQTGKGGLVSRSLGRHDCGVQYSVVTPAKPAPGLKW